ncbi:MAG: ABC transporter permease [Chloroflexota bacterium]|nr:ABC transporter permease [Chloroflexota bacterium]
MILQRSASDGPAFTTRRLRRIANYGPAFVLLAALLLFWELSVRVGQVSPLILVAPSAILQALAANWDILYVHTLQTLLETLIGMAAATLLGLLLAILLDISSWVRNAIYPLLIASQTVPMVALAPLLLIWFGYELGEKVIVVTLYCFFPIAVACADGLLGTEPELLRLMRSMHASRWQILWLVRLPGAMPAFFSGLRIAVTYSMTGAIVAEYVGAYQGLGIFILTSTNSRAVALVFAAILIVVVLSLLLFSLVSLIERLALPWFYSTARSST